MSCQLITAGTDERDREFLLPATIDAASTRATAVAT
jgi:hypothetical protein